jgi:LmbE family N-acetylglucosaminyl deacetylase
MSKKILIIAAHPDDETIGCGGTIKKHIDINDQVYVLFMTNGISARSVSKKQITIRKENLKKVAKLLNYRIVDNFNLRDNEMDIYPLLKIVKKIEKIIKKLQPEIIYTHFENDLNIDHQITYKAVLTACRPVPNLSIKEINCFEVLSNTNWGFYNLQKFKPNYYVDISNFINAKKKALSLYQNEIKDDPHTRSLDNIIRNNKVRGQEVGLNSAEAFFQVRKII